MHALAGTCHCGSILLNLQLAHEPGHCQPRACDCAFCSKHGAAYVSDPQGSLRIRINDPRKSGTYRQGNELAEMLLCTHCGVLMGALYRAEGRVYATVNVRVIEGADSFGADQSVSPKQLSGDEKISRWKTLWFSSVELV